jgi:hypothetical protein
MILVICDDRTWGHIRPATMAGTFLRSSGKPHDEQVRMLFQPVLLGRASSGGMHTCMFFCNRKAMQMVMPRSRL